MRVDTLPSPGLLPQGMIIRNTMAKAISGIEIVAGVSGGKASQAAQFDAFLVFARSAISAFIETVVPTITARAIPASAANKLYLTASEGLDPAFVPAASAFAIAGVAKTVSKVEIDGPFLILTVSAPWVAGNVSTVAYTQPGAASNVRDRSGNLLASFTASAIVNGVS